MVKRLEDVTVGHSQLSFLEVILSYVMWNASVLICLVQRKSEDSEGMTVTKQGLEGFPGLWRVSLSIILQLR